MESGDECMVCRKHAGKITPPGGVIYEDDLVFASHSLIPPGESSNYLGILFVEPKRHVEGMEELSEAEGARLGMVLARLSRALQRATEAEHIYVFVLGHHVPHLHIWLVPRYFGTPHEYWGFRVDEWPDAPRGGAREIQVLCDRVRSHST